MERVSRFGFGTQDAGVGVSEKRTNPALGWDVQRKAGDGNEGGRNVTAQRVQGRDRCILQWRSVEPRVFPFPPGSRGDHSARLLRGHCFGWADSALCELEWQ